jgi:predicted acylesterase/phospholipase RssA
MIEPDIVVGASIGALNGWLIAGGCRGDDLVYRWMHFEHGSRPKWRIPTYLSDGLIDTDPVEMWVQEVYSSCTARARFGCVATEFRTMRPRLFQSPAVTWRHLMASCAVPLFLRQHRLDGVYYADGGLLDPLPVWAAVEMGATRIIAVNLLPNRPPVIRAVVRCAQAYGRFCPPSVDGVELITIAPSEPLGRPADTIYWTRTNAERWIRLGEKDTCSLKHLVVKCLEHV